MVKLLLDGQQRITSLYGVCRGHPPKFFDGNKASFYRPPFHLENEVFEFYQPTKWKTTRSDRRDRSDEKGHFRARRLYHQDFEESGLVQKVVDYAAGCPAACCTDVDLHVEEVTGSDKTIDVVVEIFNRVNSGGTKLSKGDLALAKICAEWPDARVTMKQELSRWSKADYRFSLDWLLHAVNAVVTGEARFSYLHNKSATEIRQGLESAIKHIDTCLNMIGGRLGIDHDRVFFAKFAVPVMVRYLRKNGGLTEKERDKLLFWFVQSGMWGRFSGSTESFLDKDFSAIENDGPSVKAA